MSESAPVSRAPATTWEYAVSAADQLLLWHADSVPSVLREPLRTHAVVLMAAAVVDTARAHGVTVTGVPLNAVTECAWLHAASALEGCDAPAGMGGKEVALLLEEYGGGEFEAVQRVARDVLGHHLEEAGGGPVTIADRVPELRRADRARRLRALADVVGEDC